MVLLNAAANLRVGMEPADRAYVGSDMVWQRAEGPAKPILLAAEWDIASGTSVAYGPMSAVGNLVIVRSVHRAGTNNLEPLIADNGDNAWHPVGDLKGGVYRGVVAGGSGDLSMWYTIVEHPFDGLNVQFAGQPSVSRIIAVTEWTGVAATGTLLDSAGLENPSMTGPLPVAEVTTNVSGALVVGALGATVSNRSFELISPGFVAGKSQQVQQTTLIAASRPDLPPGTYGPQWSLSGAASTTGLLTAAFRPDW